jgi:acyl-CoA thioesterase-1
MRALPRLGVKSVAAIACVVAVIAVPACAEETAKPARQQYECSVPQDVTRLAHPLPRTGKRLAAGETLKIVAIGSSSTAGAGASSDANTYPSRLAAELKSMFPRQFIVVVNRGVNGDEARGMLARFDKEVIAENPDLVLWQVGTNSVLRDDPIAPAGRLIHEGLSRLKAAGTDVILIDPQFAPKVLAKADAATMVDLLAQAADVERVDLFRRFAVMRHWRQVSRIPFEVFVSEDELHMNDWSYGCIAKLLAGAIAEAATRSSQTATAAAR